MHSLVLQTRPHPALLPAEDIGDTPLELLQPVLLRCHAEQLAAIEDGTRKGLHLSSQYPVLLLHQQPGVKMTLCLCTGMEEENCMRRCNHIGRECTTLNLATGTVLLLRSAVGSAI